MSHTGCPDLEEAIDEEEADLQPFSLLNVGDEKLTAAAETSFDESVWGTVKENFSIEEIMNGTGEKLDGKHADNDEGREEEWDDKTQLYIPESAFTFSRRKRPKLPRLPVESLPAGSSVWIVDEYDVCHLLREYWSESHRVVCNGRSRGTVVRHSGKMTLVAFRNDHAELDYALTFPRICLSTEPIEAYEESGSYSSRSGPLLRVFGNFASQPGCCQDGPNNCEVLRCVSQYYESLYILEVQSPRLVEIRNHIVGGRGEEALHLLETFENESSVTVSTLILRSRAKVSLGRYEEAMADAQRIIALEPLWVKGYLCAARALSGMGKFKEACDNVKCALRMLPNSQELHAVEELNSFMLSLQGTLPVDSLGLYIDGQYRKQLVARRYFRASEIVYAEASIILAMESPWSESSDRCCVCLKPASSLTPVSTECSPLPGKRIALFCSEECRQRSSLFFSIEYGRHRAAVDRARDLIGVNSAPAEKRTLFDLTYMATRLFLMVYVTYGRLRAQQDNWREDEQQDSVSSYEGFSEPRVSGNDGVLPLQSALQQLGVFPLVNADPQGNMNKKVYMVYDNLTTFFTKDEKEMFSLHLFYALYEYVSVFAVGVKGSNCENGSVLYYLPQLLGAVRRVSLNEANCKVVVDETSSSVKLVALRDIGANEDLSIPSWDVAPHL